MSEFGKIAEVSIITAGSEVVQDHAAGDTILYLDDVADFDEEGGVVTINGLNLQYLSTDDDASTMILAGPLSAPITDESEVLAYPVASEKWASVVLEDGEDTILARIPMHMSRDIEDGIRPSDAQETCEVELRGSEWVVIDILGNGSPDSHGIQWKNDTYIITAADVAAGTATCPLTYEPMLEAVDAKLNGVGQGPSEYTIDYNLQKVTWPLSGWEKAGHRLSFHYTYLKGTPGLSSEPRFKGYVSAVAVQNPTWVKLPEGIISGDRLVAFLDRGSVSMMSDDWELVARVTVASNTRVYHSVWTRAATKDDQGGSSILVPTPIGGSDGCHILIAVYTPSEGVSVLANAPDPAAWNTEGNFPPIAVPDSGSTVLSYMTIYGAPTPRTMTDPAGINERASLKSGANRIWYFGDQSVPKPSTLPAVITNFNVNSDWQSIRLALRPG